MTMKVITSSLLLLLIIFSSLIFQPALSRSHRRTLSRVRKWCKKTPHPGPCNYYMAQFHNRRLTPKHSADFQQLMVQVALERALSAKLQTHEFGDNCENKRQKAAWTDCLNLFDNTVSQLNRTRQGLANKHKNNTNYDAQTWLSAALTNIRTCREGSLELNVSSFINPIYTSSNNLSELISNSLAIGSRILGAEEKPAEGTDSFPEWVSNQDRRLLAASSIKANLVVAKDGSGHFRTVQAALNAAAKRRRMTRFVIHVKKGVYKETIQVIMTNSNIMLVGDGLKNTVITGSRSVKGGYTTYSSATAGIDGLGFIARGITFSNTAGPSKGQAVALRSASDLSVFYRCGITGYQDTLFVHSQRQFYRESYIYGTIDFIFGNAAVVFQNCIIYVRNPIWGQVNVITAQARDDQYQSTAMSFHNSQFRAAPDLKPMVGKVKTFLGRPWKQYARVVLMKCYIDTLIDPAGWMEWQESSFALTTLYYGEYKNLGPRSSTRNRVKWPGFHVITSANVATSFTVGGLIAGRSWLPATGIPFTSGL